MEAGNEFNLSNVTLDGEDKDIYQAIRSWGTGTIKSNIIKNIAHSVYGWGVAVFADMTISNNTFESIRRVGVDIYDMSDFGGSEDVHVTVTDNTFTGIGDGVHYNIGVLVQAGTTGTIEDNTFSEYKGVAGDGSTSSAIGVTDDLVHGGVGYGTEATITGNEIRDNAYGIAIGFGDGEEDITVTANYNNIYDNEEYGVWSIDKPAGVATTEVDATENWWGDANGPGGEGPGDGDKVSENVVFDPWAGSPF